MFERIKFFLGTNKFFYICLGVFVVESLWIALSAAYSMPFDENTHLTAIRLYSEHWLPFWSDHANDPANLGAISRNPSYLYHYLMSFPYRIFAHFTHSETAQVIFLRLFSIGFFSAGLVLYRKLILKTKVSFALANLVMLLLILTPLSPFLAAQINYDNLLFMMSGLCLLYFFSIKHHKSLALQPSFEQVFMLISLCLLTCLVKLAFLPIAFLLIAGLFPYNPYLIWGLKSYWKKELRPVVKNVLKTFRATSTIRVSLIILLMITSLGLFSERYFLNIARYDKLTPSCTEVLSEQKCSQNGAWARDQKAKADKTNHLPLQGRISYTVKEWFRIMYYQLFFSLNTSRSHFDVGAPLPLPFYGGMFIAGLGLVSFILMLYRLRTSYVLISSLIISLVYCLVLWIQNWGAYSTTGQVLGVQARYLIIVLPLSYLLCAIGIDNILQGFQKLKYTLTGLIVAIFLLQGGGVGVFIIRSNPDWYWPNQTVIGINQEAQKILRAITIGA